MVEAGITSPPNPIHGPWRRHTAQAVEADIRAVPESAATAQLLAGSIGLATLSALRRRGGAERR